ncbi:MAG: GNAT family N-acetyltransferase [Firmicutes bacterium]|nr:GNAT family N-acetyltransferase [Bacillota bacterium]
MRRYLRFCELEEAQIERLYRFITTLELRPSFRTLAEMVSDYTGPVFECGRQHISVWLPGPAGAAERVVGCLGVVTREAASQGVVYLAGLYLEPGQAGLFGELLEAALGLVREVPHRVVKLGIPERHRDLVGEAERAGFRLVYRALEMRYAGQSAAASVLDRPETEGSPPAGPAAEGPRPVRPGAEWAPGGPHEAGSAARLRFEQVDRSRLVHFLDVHNAAFSATPNGATFDEEQAREVFRESLGTDLLQVGYAGGKPVCVVELAVKGDEGEILGLGVLPEEWGRGYGREGLARAMETLIRHGVQKICLTVIDANRRAVNLYLRNGFVVDRILSTWLERRVGPALTCERC